MPGGYESRVRMKRHISEASLPFLGSQRLSVRGVAFFAVGLSAASLLCSLFLRLVDAPWWLASLWAPFLLFYLFSLRSAMSRGGSGKTALSLIGGGVLLGAASGISFEALSPVESGALPWPTVGALGGMVLGLLLWAMLQGALYESRRPSHDANARALSRLGLSLSLFGAAGAWLGGASVGLWIGLAAISFGVLLSLSSVRHYTSLLRWLPNLWAHKIQGLQRRSERLPNGWESTPMLVYSSHEELYDTLLFYSQGSLQEGAPYRNIDAEDALARLPFEPSIVRGEVRKSLFKTALRVFVSLGVGAFVLSRISFMAGLPAQYCSERPFLDLIQTETGLVTVSQDGKSLAHFTNGAWEVSPITPSPETTLTGLWGKSHALFASAEDGIYRLDLNEKTWKKLFHSEVALNDIYGTALTEGELTLLAVGAYGLVVSSTDSGASWLPRPLGVENSLYAIWGSRLGGFFVAGSEGLIIYSNNSGAEWYLQETNTKDAIIDIWGSATDSTLPAEIYALTSEGALLALTSKGWGVFETFDKIKPTAIFGEVTTRPNSNFSKVSRLYVVGQQGAISRHDGHGWIPLETNSGAALWSGIATEDGLFVTGQGSLLHSTDDGESFSPLLSPWVEFLRCTNP